MVRWDSHLWRHAPLGLFTLLTALNRWHGTPCSFSTLSFYLFPRCSSQGFLLPAHHRVICKRWGPWRLLPDLLCQPVNHYSRKERGAGSTLKAVSPPPWPPPHQSCPTTHLCDLNLIHIQLQTPAHFCLFSPSQNESLRPPLNTFDLLKRNHCIGREAL